MRRLRISLICMMLLYINIYAHGLTPTILQSEDSLWFATKHGLYRYNKTQNEWIRFSSANGLAGDDIRKVGIEEGIIWVATDCGVSNSDVRFNDWRSYSTDVFKGAKCLAFSKDYVWIGTNKGVARFDKILEEWKTYTTTDGLVGNAVNDVVVVNETAWFATSNGISKLDINYNKWTNFDTVLPSKNVIKALSVGEYIWFITDSGIVRYDKKLTSWKTYSKTDGIVSYLVNDVIVDGDNIWLATQDGVSTYDAISDSWTEDNIYYEMLPSKNVASIAIDGDVIWFSTDKGISSYERNTAIWRHFTSQNELLDDHGQDIIISDSVYAVTEKGVNIYDKKTQDWDNYKFSTGSAEKSSADKGFRLDEKGMGFNASKETQIRLSGISSLEFDDSSKLSPKRQDGYQWDTKNDLSLRGTFPDSRSLTGFYNDLREDNVEYGLTYRGNDKDTLFEANVGKFDAKMRNSELIKDVNMLGADAHLRQSFDHTRLNLQPRYGERVGYYGSDFFQYQTGTSIYQLKHTDILPETETVIADMEVLQRGVDYIVIYPNGWLMFPQEELLEDGENIEVQYQYESDKENKETRVAVMTTGIEMDSNHYAGLDVLHEDKLNVISLNEESKNVEIGDLSMKIKPEIAYSRNDKDGIGSKAEITATAPRTQLKLDYEGYSDNFFTPDGRETKYGKLEQHLGAYSRFDITQWLPLTLRFQQERSDNDISEITEQDAKANLVLSKQNYPTIALTGKGNRSKTLDSDEQQQTSVRTDFQYNLPTSLLSCVRIRKLDINSYYRESNQRNELDKYNNKARTGYLNLNFSPIERFDLSGSYKTNKSLDKERDAEFYQLRDDLRRILISSNFASIKGTIINLYYDDLQSHNRAIDGDLESVSNTYLTTGINLVPGIWSRKLRMITLSTRYSLLEQTVPIDSEIADSNSRALRFQVNLTPYNWVAYTGTYDVVKSWLSHPQSDPAKYDHKYNNEVEIKPNSISRIVLAYDQENVNEGVTKNRSYLPSVLYETKFTGNWTLKLRNVYYRHTINENDKTTEKGTTVMPSMSFRYMNNELPHNGRIYVTNTLSLSVDRLERDTKESASETYTASSSLEWRFTRNLSSRIRASISYKDNHSESDETSADIYVRITARF